MGVFTMMEQLMPIGNGPPPHVHERYHEVFYIIEGEIEFQVGTEGRRRRGRAPRSGSRPARRTASG